MINKHFYWKDKKRPDISVRLKGIKRSKETKEKLRLSHLGQKSHIKNKTYEERYGKEKAKEIKKKLKESHLGIPSHRKNLTYEEEFGKEEAEKKKQKISQKSKEQFSSKESKKIQSERIKKYIKENPEWRELKRKQTKDFLEKNLEYKEMHSKRMKEYYSKQENKDANAERLKKFYLEYPEVLQKMSETQKKIWQTPEKREFARERRLKQRFLKSGTDIERIMEKEFTLKQIKFIPQFRLGNFLFDFAIPIKEGDYLLVECDEKYWHSLEGNKLSDRRKEEFCRKNNFSLLRFKGADIKKNVAKCVNKIEEKLIKFITL